MFRCARRLVVILLGLQSALALSRADTVTNADHAGPGFSHRAAADAIVTRFMQQYEIPGLSLAISHKDRLVYAAAFGWADAEKAKPLMLTNRLRLASCSKPITALAILRLVEQGRLDLDAPVFGDKSLLGAEYGVPTRDKQPATVTVRQLLQHAAGGWGNKNEDPMFAFHDLSLEQLMRRTLAERELTAPPGTVHAYSNFGFAVLGKVIEKVTGTNYEAAVRDLVLRPCDAAGMRISAARGTRPEPDEPDYFGANGEHPDRLRPELMQAHGGWIAEPLELLRVLDRVDGDPAVPDILEPGSLRLLLLEGIPGSGYSLGWAVNQARNKWHLGSMPGTFAVACCSARGYNWAVLMNRRSHQAQFARDADGLVWKILDAVPDWPEKGTE